MASNNGRTYRVAETTQFRRDLKRIMKMGRYDPKKLREVVRALAEGMALPPQCKNHKLSGKYEGCEECHIQGDWLLIYRKLEDVLILQLMRTGRHADVFEK